MFINRELQNYVRLDFIGRLLWSSELFLFRTMTIMDYVSQILNGTPVKNGEKDKKKCIVCWVDEPMVLLYPCGHYDMCSNCAIQVEQNSGLCPVCRRVFVDVVKVYQH